MILHVREAKYIRDYKIWVRLSDGTEGEVDLSEELEGDVFKPLKDIKKFKSFKVDPTVGTIVWKNGADLAPEFLHDKICVVSH
jgi:hypothetical protein